jgi:hypothetical protein
MTQSNFSIANENGALFRADANTALQALATQSAGLTAPATTYPFQLWWDTTNNLLKQRNSANATWLTIGAIDPGLGTFIPRFQTGNATLASAATTDLGSIPATMISLTGTATITSFGSSMVVGETKIVSFAAGIKLTQSSNISLNNGVNITTALGDVGIITCTGSGSYSVIYIKANRATATPQGRLTLTSGTPVLDDDVSGATAIYYTPYVGNIVPIYASTSAAFVLWPFSELTLTLVSSHAANNLYDIFAFLDPSDGVTVRIGTGPAWSSGTARGSGAGTTQLTRINGLWVNTVAITLRNSSTTYSVGVNQATYLGTFSTNGSNGHTDMEFKPTAASGGTNNNLFLWNAYNRVMVTALCRDSTASWTYSSGTVRAANNSSSNRINFILGKIDGFVRARYDASCSSSGGVSARVGVALDITTAFNGYAPPSSASVQTHAFGEFFLLPGEVGGLHFISAVESASGATATFYGGGSIMGLIIQLEM